jgi:capsular polysaccharide transport system permease protein
MAGAGLGSLPVRAVDAGPPPAARPRPASRFRRLRVLSALVVREMSTKFGRSAGGYFWALAEPLGGILLLAVAFSLALRSPPLGTSFILFYATGMIPFSLFRTMAGGVSGAIRSNKGLLSYPVVAAFDAVLAKFVLNFITITLVAAILFMGIILGLGPHVNLDLGAVALAIAMAAVLGLGVGTLNCVLFGFFPTWKNVWTVLNRPLFIISGIFFTYEMVPKAFQAVLWWNPIVHIVGVMRSGFYGSYEAHYVSLPYVMGIGLGTFVIGAYLLRRHESALIER